MTTWALTIGEAFCWGCKTCEVACKQENGAAKGESSRFAAFFVRALAPRHARAIAASFSSE